MTISNWLQPVFILISAIFGIFLGFSTKFDSFSVLLIEPLLIILLYFLFQSFEVKKLKYAFKNFKFTIFSLMINFIWTPIFSYILGKIFFQGEIDLQIGIMVLMVTPCTDWYLIFTGLAKGNVELGATVLPLNLILQILFLPIYLAIFFGGKVNISLISIVLSIVKVLILPIILVYITKKITRMNDKTKEISNIIERYGDRLQILFLCLAVMCMFSSQSKNVLTNPTLQIKMILPLIIFFLINFLLAWNIWRREKYEDRVSLIFTTLARNSPLSLAIAITSFPNRPLISLTLVIGPLIELPILSIVSTVLKGLKNRN